MQDDTKAGATLSLRRAAPLIALALAAVAALVLLGDALSFEALARRHEALQGWRARNAPLAALTFVAVYAGAVAVSAPGAVWLTLAGGLLFGAWLGGALTVAAATAGATAVFLVAKTSLGDALRARAGGWLKRLEQRFQQDEVSFMLALRLTPIAPFFIVNVVPAFLGVRPVTFVWTTFVGIMPATFVFASIGAGLGDVIARGAQPDLGVILRWPVLGPLLGLAALSLAPVAWKAWRGRGGRA